VKLFIVLTLFAQHYDAVVFDCLYAIEDWVIIEKIYGCSVQNLKIEIGDDHLTSVSKSHLKGKKNEDVIALNIENATCPFIPKDIDKSFPNLKGLRISQSKLKAIGSDDLKQFPELKVLCLWANLIKTLDGNLLMNTPQIEFVNFGHNYIMHVGPNIFEPLKNLVAVYFEENICINHTKPFEVNDLKFQLAVQCPPSMEMLETTLIYGGKLATKNDEVEKKINALETRIAELEEHARK
jgi:hypothetical protein